MYYRSAFLFAASCPFSRTYFRYSRPLHATAKLPPVLLHAFYHARLTITPSCAVVAASTCENGMAGIQNGIICCAENCGQCGGAGCGSIPGTGGSDYCCSTAIAINGTDCSVTLAAPCIMGNWVPTPAPAVLVTASPVGRWRGVTGVGCTFLLVGAPRVCNVH